MHPFHSGKKLAGKKLKTILESADCDEDKINNPLQPGKPEQERAEHRYA